MYALSNKIFQRDPDGKPEARLVVDFTKAKFALTKQHPFNIKSEDSYNVSLSDNALSLGLKKTNLIAYTDIPKIEYQDHVIDAKIRLDSMGGYASTGIIFRIMSQDSYYMALVSSKGYFRFDVVKDGAPRTLIAWTEIANFDGSNIDLKIITYGSYLIFTVNGTWVAEISDDSIQNGTLGFVAASYDTDYDTGAAKKNSKYTCAAYLNYISIDARVSAIENEFKKWTSDTSINADSRLRLAETFAVMDKPAKAMDQINRAWKRRDDVIRGIATTYTEARTKKELLLASRMSFRLGQFKEALEYIDSLIEQWPASPEGKLAFAEKIKILNELDMFEDLKEFLQSQADKLEKDIDYYIMYARCCFELKEYRASANAWKEAYKMNRENGVYAANAANSLEQMGRKKEAAAFYLEAGKNFLRQDNNAELEVLIPKILTIGKDNWEAHGLAGKWYFSIEDYDNCNKEFVKAEKLRIEKKPRPAADPALYYLWGLVYFIKNKKKDAVRLLEKAVKLAPDYELFSEKLKEIKNANN
jgi:tetratricopeptide (TPR) repeat protein